MPSVTIPLLHSTARELTKAAHELESTPAAVAAEALEQFLREKRGHKAKFEKARREVERQLGMEELG